jgi:hypothetical protein
MSKLSYRKKQEDPAPWTPGLWINYTPVATALSGTITSYTAFGRYTRLGPTIFISINIEIVTNGTAASALAATLPFPCHAVRNSILVGRNSNFVLYGEISAGTSSCVIREYDQTYPGGDGYSVYVTGFYESATNG